MKITFEKSGRKGGKASPLLLLAVVVFLGVFLFWMMGSDAGPIEDANGSDDRSLVTITDDNIRNLDLGAYQPIGKSGAQLEVGGVLVGTDLAFSSKEFSGVYEVLYNNYFPGSDFVLRLNYLQVRGGNFRMVVLHEGEIVADIEPSDEPIELMLEDIGGTVSLRIAGESADYAFAMSAHDYDMFAHP